MQTHILGFPRIGADRELKKAQESYWRRDIPQNELTAVGEALKVRHWEIQQKAGLSCVATGDFSYYDHVLDTSLMLGAVPERFGAPEADLDLYFRMARGDARQNIPAMEMTKWFNTNYHYIVPEISAGQKLSLTSKKLIDDTKLAWEKGFVPKPVVVGPVTYLSLAKGVDGFDCFDKLDEALGVYEELLGELDEYCEWIQIDEPILCADMSDKARAAFPKVYSRLNASVTKSKLLLATYFDVLDDNLDLGVSSGCAGLHVDLVRGAKQLDAVLANLPEKMVLSAGVVEGRNIWKTDLSSALKTLSEIAGRLGDERVMVGSSCSLLHSPVDLDNEKLLNDEIKQWLAFAVQKCAEVELLGSALADDQDADAFNANAKAIAARKASPLVNNMAVRERTEQVDDAMLKRIRPYTERIIEQAWLNLPLFPTTTIGSYPQTAEIRKCRRDFKFGDIGKEAYESFMKEEIRKVVQTQEDLGLDVLVHGEAERNDMVEYFGQQLDGFCFTANGWVQSYGSRCVKPPVIFGDVSRPTPMTVEWITYAQSLTKKPLKGMLTGPVTILCWSFVRDDMERSEVCRQLALAIRDEVADLEQAGINIIQMDEAAFSEGLPLKWKDRAEYLRWAVDCFRLSTSGVADSTQIHSHMCYSEFNDIMDSIADMDADVISIESSRSRMELLDAFRAFDYPNEIGPGVYDIHSPRVPSVEEVEGLLERALTYIPKERLWVNPDCGLKTRAWPETLEALENMVEATKLMRIKH